MHVAAAGALWNLSINHVNALRIVEEGGVLVLGRMCTSSPSKLARFLAALTLAYIFDGRYSKPYNNHIPIHFSIMSRLLILSICTGWMNL